MADRARRLAHNEALFREVNEQIESLNRGLAEISDHQMHIVCECSDLRCSEQLVVSIPDYERVRTDAELFFVVPSHERREVERVVEEANGFNVVRKVDAEAAQIARETDPR